MQTILFTNSNVPLAKQMFDQIMQAPDLAPLLVDDQEKLTGILQKSRMAQPTIVLLVYDIADLSMGSALRQCLSAAQLIIILPRETSSLISPALSLNPRVLTFADTSAEKIIALLEHMALEHPTAAHTE